MHELINGIKGHVDSMLQQMPQPVWGIVTDVDPNRYMVRCLVQPSNVTTGWLSVGSVMVGPGWGLLAPPMAGIQAQLMPTDGAGDNYTVTGLCYSTQALPPKPGGNVVQPGEFAVVSKAGSYLYFRTNGDVLLHTTGNLTATVAGNLNLTTTGTSQITSTGNLTVNSSGQISIAATGQTSISGSSINLDSSTVVGGNGTAQALATQEFVLSVYSQHRHTGVQTGGGTTGTPTILPDVGSLTTVFSAV